MSQGSHKDVEGSAREAGVQSAIEFTKHIMTLSAAGVAFIATLDVSGIAAASRAFLIFALLALALSLGGGLVVWSRASVMIGKGDFDLMDTYLRHGGRINIFSFGVGVLCLGLFIIIKMVFAASAHG